MSLLDERKQAELREENQVDFSFGIPDIGRFRANAFSQRGTLALALRVVPFRVRSLEELGAPAACTTCSTSRTASCSSWVRPVRARARRSRR